MKNQLTDEGMKGKFSNEDKKVIAEVADEGLQWLEGNADAEADVIEGKKKELEAKFNPIMMRIYQETGGAGMPGMPGMPGGGMPGGPGAAGAGGAADAGVDDLDWSTNHNRPLFIKAALLGLFNELTLKEDFSRNSRVFPHFNKNSSYHVIIHQL